MGGVRVLVSCRRVVPPEKVKDSIGLSPKADVLIVVIVAVTKDL